MANLVRLALIIGTAASITGCGGSQPPTSPLQSALTQHPTRDTSSGYGYRVLFEFGRYAEYYGVDYRGARPTAGLIEVKGILYGTTSEGGKYGGGTVFSITPHGRQHVIHDFEGNDGAYPAGALVYVNGKLYGTTSDEGGTTGIGTVFRIDPTGNGFHVLHTFAGGSDGAEPLAGLVAVNGWLYGTTYEGGSGETGNGTVFGIRLSDGHERILYAFAGEPDGSRPWAPLTYARGTLYGTTGWGGKNNAGTVFSVRVTDGTERIIYNFSGQDGAGPQAGLLFKHGTLYGTTAGGGAYNNDGTVFSVDIRSSTETVLHNFNEADRDGREPEAGLTEVGGTFYGTTTYGGALGYGTVFRLDASGTETILHDFPDRQLHDGIFPEAPLLYVKHKLFGTTWAGGRNGHHCLQSQYCDYGTVFALTL